MMIPYGYKQTEVGVVPEDWDVRKIGDFTDTTAGGTPSTSHPEYWNGEILWMSSGELNNRRIHNVIGRITELGYNNSSTHMIPKNCVLIGLAGQGKTRGTVAVNYVKLCTNQSIAAIFPSKEHNSEYLYQNLRSRYEELRELSSGDGGRGGLNLTIIKNFPCAFPKLQEQNRIAEALSDVDGMISSLEKLIAKYKSIKTACLQQMFPQNGETVPRMRFPGFTGAWEQRKLGELSNIIDPHPSHRAPEEEEIGIPFVGIGDVDIDGNINYEKVRKVNESIYDEHHRRYDLAIPSLGIGRVASLGKVIRLRDDIGKYAVSPTMSIMQFTENSNIDFLYAAMNTEMFQRQFALQSNGSTRQSVGIQDLRVTEVSISPNGEEQKEIGAYFRNLDNLITLHQRKLDKAKKIKQGMMQQLLTGKIRLNN